MSHGLVFTDQYNRRAAKFLRRHPELRRQYLKTLQLLEANPFHPSLRLHALNGKWQGLHSMSINLSYRITLELLIQDGQIIPVDVRITRPCIRQYPVHHSSPIGRKATPPIWRRTARPISTGRDPPPSTAIPAPNSWPPRPSRRPTPSWNS